MLTVSVNLRVKGLDKLIYLAGPYSDKDEDLKHRRFLELTRVSAWLNYFMVVTFSPITQSHEQNEFLLKDGSWEEWEYVDKMFINKCDEVWVLLLTGWESSIGVRAEIDFARERNKKVRFIYLDGFELKEVMEEACV